MTYKESRNPNVNDIAAVGSTWINTTNGKRFVCIESSIVTSDRYQKDPTTYRSVTWKPAGVDHRYIMENAGGNDEELAETVNKLSEQLSEHIQNHPTEITVGTEELMDGVSPLDSGRLYIYTDPNVN